jgi:hypothetical protein
MHRQGFSTKNIEYFERDFLDQIVKVDSANLNIKSLENLELFRLTGIPRFWGKNDDPLNLVMENTIAGFYEGNIPIVFSVFGGKTGLEIFFGTWSSNQVKSENNSKILHSSLESSLHGLIFFKIHENKIDGKSGNLPYTGILTGSPSDLSNSKVTMEFDSLMRGIFDKNCGITVIAQPMNSELLNNLFIIVLNEIRIILDSERHSGQENPTVRQYKTRLEKYLEKLQESKSQGLWATSVYLHADTQGSLNQLKAIAKSALSGRTSIPDKIRTLQLSNRPNTLGLIVNPAPQSPGQFKWPYGYSSVHSSGDLARLVKLPSNELPGFKIKPYVRFNVSPSPGGRIEIGEIIDQDKKIGHHYRVPVKGLKKHGLVVGGTGSGKTNTIFYMLRSILEQDIPFLVLEPAKTEYRKLLYDEGFREKMHVFTLGDNTVSPFRLNPFKVFPGISVQTHLDLLKSVFNASFYMWGPLPHVLEQCLYEIYNDKGWDLTSNQNHRGTGVNSYPTLTDLYNKVDTVVNKLGYSSETSMELKSSLKTRLNSLRIGGKGLMLDTKSCIDFEYLLKKPTILELESLGDDEEKSFMMGLVLTFLYEYHVSQGFKEDQPLAHVTVIEEAHRLLGQEAKSAFTGDMKGKAVETFTNILSEIRAYGEGFIIAEQIPTKLSPDVIKNTNLKIMHRIVADDDRSVMSASMNIKNIDAPIVSTLSVGEAVVFSEGDDGAYNLQIPYAKLGEVQGLDDLGLIKQVMRTYLENLEYISPYASCSRYCTNVCKYKDIGSYEEPRYNDSYPKLLLALIERDGYSPILHKMFETGNDYSYITGDSLGVKICIAVQSGEKYFEKLGTTYNWEFSSQEEILKGFQDIYINSLRSYLDKGEVTIDDDLVTSFTSLLRENVTSIQPTIFCSRICPDDTCLYRHLLTRYLSDSEIHDSFTETINKGGAEMWNKLKSLCHEIAYDLHSSLSIETMYKVSRCFALQKTYQITDFSHLHIEQIMNILLDQSEYIDLDSGGLLE